jgi:hypothetical protein
MLIRPGTMYTLTSLACTNHSDLDYTPQAKCYSQLNTSTASISFADLLYMFYLLFLSLQLDMLGGLALLTRRSPDLRVIIFLSCAMFPTPSTCSGVVHANLRVARPKGSIPLMCVLPLTA